MRLDAFAQQTAYVLPYGQRFKIGGDRLGRGFEVAEIAGDQGVGAKLEAVAAHQRPRGARPHLGLRLLRHRRRMEAGHPGRESAATAGFGFAREGGRMSGSLEVAQPLTHADVEGRDDLAVFARDRSQFLARIPVPDSAYRTVRCCCVAQPRL